MSLIYLSSNKEYSNSSRYSYLRVIEDDSKSIYLETYNQIEVPKTENDNYHIVEEKEVNRLDIISKSYYGTPRNWWMIALANNLIDPFVVNKGTMLRIPAMSSVVNVISGLV